MPKTIQTKQCRKCKQFKPTSEFHKSRRNKDGLQGYCKTCNIALDRKYQKTAKGKATRKRNRQSEKGRTTNLKAVRKYEKTEKGKVVKRATLKRFKVRNPNHFKAKNAVMVAVRAGKLPRPDTLLCHYCPKPAQQYHHHKGYAPEHWLDVVPVCNQCHNKHRRKIA